MNSAGGMAVDAPPPAGGPPLPPVAVVVIAGEILTVFDGGTGESVGGGVSTGDGVGGSITIKFVS